MGKILQFRSQPELQPFNRWSAWLYLIGTPARAKKLLRLLPRIAEPQLDIHGESLQSLTYSVMEPAICPTRIMFGEHESHRLYANPELRPALDAWDTGLITKRDIFTLCNHVASGKYRGAVYAEQSPPQQRAA